MTARRASAIWGGLAGVALLVLLASLMAGSVALGPVEVLAALFGRGATTLPDGAGMADAAGAAASGVDSHAVAFEVVRHLRLPRALAGFACGGLLALAGALLQVLLRNPLADPFVLGASGGAAVFALAAMLASVPAWGIDAASGAGALFTVGLVLALAHREWRGAGTSTGVATPRLLLIGVVIAAGWGALTTLLLSLAPDGTLRGMVFWLTGDLGGASRPLFAMAGLALTTLAALPVAPAMNALLRGSLVAGSLGVEVGRLRLRIYLVASLATAVAVATAGSIGFVGLVVPHLLRLAFGNDQRMLLPASILGGGTLTMAADLLARTVVAPMQLPVGSVTALVGVPLFLWLLIMPRRP